MRIAARPTSVSDDANPYTRLFYNALRTCGIRVTEDLIYSDAWLADNVSSYDAIHLQWIEYYWPRRGTPLTSRLRAIASIRNFLRTANRLGKGVIVTLHNLEPHESCDWVDRVGFRTVVRNCHLVVCHSRESQHRICTRFGVPKERVVVMYHGNYCNEYPAPRPRKSIRKRLGLCNDKPLVSCLGLLRDYKGTDVACDAIHKLDGAAQFLVAGKPSDSKVLNDLQHLVGAIPNARLEPASLSKQLFADYMAASDVILLPYRKVTGSGALLASWTFGRTAITSDLPFFAEMIEQAPGSGRLFPNGDSAALAIAIDVELNRSASERSTAASAACERFRWETCISPVAYAIRNASFERKR